MGDVLGWATARLPGSVRSAVSTRAKGGNGCGKRLRICSLVSRGVPAKGNGQRASGQSDCCSQGRRQKRCAAHGIAEGKTPELGASPPAPDRPGRSSRLYGAPARWQSPAVDSTLLAIAGPGAFTEVAALDQAKPSESCFHLLRGSPKVRGRCDLAHKTPGGEFENRAAGPIAGWLNSIAAPIQGLVLWAGGGESSGLAAAR